MKTILAAATLALFAACSDDGPAVGPGPGDGGANDGPIVIPGDAGVPLDIAQSEFRRLVCERIHGCCTAADLAGNDTVGTDVASCQAALDPETLFFLADIAASIQQGRVIYHADKMALCLEELRTRSCELIKMPPGDLDVIGMCDGVFEPTVPLGGACLEFWDCKGGWCAGDFGDLKDVCTPRGELGAVCDEGPECFSRICDDNKCQPRPPASGSLCKLGTVGEGEHTPPGPKGVNSDAGVR
jgi:hypothetical protein